MRRRTVWILLACIAAVEILSFFFMLTGKTDGSQDTVLVNKALQSVQRDWAAIESHEDQTGLDYVVLDLEGTVLFKTRPGLRESLNEAVMYRDTILDIQADGTVVGKLILYNDSVQAFRAWKQGIMLILAAAVCVQYAVCAGYLVYVDRIVIKPFHRLEGFAERVAGGDLDVPLEMDRQNLFGPFTESFDIMRSELKRARQAEARANGEKKELVAKLSHDIRTPVASIKAVAEVGAALTDNERVREDHMRIIRKADQIDALITDLFTATLEELQQLPVTPQDIESGEIGDLLRNADYLQRAKIPPVPACILYADRLRLQQVFDNIFNNSYKYADTEIEVMVYREEGCLAVSIEDYGGGVSEGEVPFLKEKFRRGGQAEHVEGAGLGLYISDHFMREMKGGLDVRNGAHGLRVTVLIGQSGKGF